MTNANLLKSCKVLLISNIVFWFCIALYFSLFKYGGNNNYLLIKILLFAEPTLYLISFIGILKKVKIIYLFSLILTLGNTVLSVTDQLDLSDVVSLILSVLVFLNLIFIWKQIFKRIEDISS